MLIREGFYMDEEKNKAWQNFVESGKIESYLKYKQYDENVETGLKASTHLNSVTERDINTTG